MKLLLLNWDFGINLHIAPSHGGKKICPVINLYLTNKQLMQTQMKDTFEKDGYVFPVEVFSVEEAAGLLRR